MSISLDGSLRNIEKVLIVDGYSATGKKLLCMLLQTFQRVEKMEMNNFVSELSCLKFYDKISLDGYKSTLKVHLNITLNNIMLSRSMNFRPFDGSSIFNTFNKFEYFKRLLSKEGNYVNDFYRKKNPILHLMTHYCYPVSADMQSVLGNNLCYITMVRHPVYCISHIKYLLENINKSNQRFNFIGVRKKNILYPWYFDVNLDEKDTLIDHAIKYFVKMSKIEEDFDKKNINNKNLVKIPFEHFIMNTKNYLDIVSQKLNTVQTKNTMLLLKKEKLPSKFFSKRTELRTFYKHFVNRDKEETQLIYNSRLKQIKMESSNKNFDDFLEILCKYEDNYSIDYFSTKKFIN